MPSQIRSTCRTTATTPKTKYLVKKKQQKAVRVELRAGEGLHGPEKQGKSASDMKSSLEKYNQQ